MMNEYSVRGAQFHAMVVAKEVLGEMSKLALTARCDTEVRRKTLQLLEEWAAQLRIPQYAEVYNGLRNKGVEFPGGGSRAVRHPIWHELKGIRV
jgi:hypothetical protein